MKESTCGWINGFIGVVIFAGSLPATRVAIADFSPIFLTSARATIATVCAVVLLLWFKQPRPQVNDLPALAISALGVVVGFPFLTALALQYMTSAHSIVFIGLLPLCTAIFAVIRGGEQPQPLFWLFSVLGASCVAGYALINSNHTSFAGSFLMLGAVVICGLGYAEGAQLSRKIGGWQVISWSLLLSIPIMFPLALLSMPSSFEHVTVAGWISLSYVAIFSMLLGFVFWYKGLAQGGIAAISQLQLLQPFIGLTLAAFLLHETISGSMLVVTVAAVICVIGAKYYARSCTETSSHHKC